MYARNYGNGDNMQSFFRGEYNIPSNYSGNAFIADEPPDSDLTASPKAKSSPTLNKMPEEELPSGTVLRERSDSKQTSETGLLRSILSRFERDFKLDDLLLIGLIILLIQNDRSDCEKNSDEIILILVFLFLCGF